MRVLTGEVFFFVLYNLCSPIAMTSCKKWRLKEPFWDVSRIFHPMDIFRCLEKSPKTCRSERPAQWQRQVLMMIQCRKIFRQRLLVASSQHRSGLSQKRCSERVEVKVVLQILLEKGLIIGTKLAATQNLPQRQTFRKNDLVEKRLPGELGSSLSDILTWVLPSIVLFIFRVKSQIYDCWLWKFEVVCCFLDVLKL